MLSLPPITLRLRGWKLIDRVALAFLLLCAISLGAACGLLFVYASDLPEIRALETYRPNVVTEIYADDGQLVGSFALQRRILMTYEQCPKVLYNAVTSIEDQHYEEHWGIDFPRMFTRGVAPSDQGAHHRRRQHHHHAACGKSFPRSQRHQLSPQDAGNAAGAADRAPLHQAADFHDVRQPGLSGARQLRLCGRRRNFISASRSAI